MPSATRVAQYGYYTSGDAVGFLQSVTDALNIQTTTTRDALGRTLDETRGGITTSFEWDALSNLESGPRLPKNSGKTKAMSLVFRVSGIGGSGHDGTHRAATPYVASSRELTKPQVNGVCLANDFEADCY